MDEPMRFELPPPPPRARRTNAERTAETRSKVLAAVVDTIAERGFAGATAQAISARAGVTWGAVQHHFGGKEGLLLAVLEDSFNRFSARLTDVRIEGAPLEERVSIFVDRAWEHFRSRHFRSTFEILLNYLGKGEHVTAGGWRPQMIRAWDGVWSRIFADATLPAKRRRVLQHYTVSTLSGLAAIQILGGGEARPPATELALLKDTLIRTMTAAR